MYMYIYIYKCACAYAYAYTYTYAYTCAYTCYLYIPTYAHMYIYIYTYMYPRLHPKTRYPNKVVGCRLQNLCSRKATVGPWSTCEEEASAWKPAHRICQWFRVRGFGFSMMGNNFCMDSLNGWCVNRHV